MGNGIHFQKKNNRLSNQELSELGKTARKERDALLERRPKLREFQKEIDRRLENAGNLENRMAVLGLMIEANLNELQKHLSRLSDTTSKFLNMSIN